VKKTLIRILKDYNNTSCLGTVQMHFLNIYWEERGSFWLSSVILFSFLSKSFTCSTIILTYWTTFETLTEIGRDSKERQVNSAWTSARYYIHAFMAGQYSQQFSLSRLLQSHNGKMKACLEWQELAYLPYSLWPNTFIPGWHLCHRTRDKNMAVTLVHT